MSSFGGGESGREARRERIRIQGQGTCLSSRSLFFSSRVPGFRLSNVSDLTMTYVDSCDVCFSFSLVASVLTSFSLSLSLAHALVASPLLTTTNDVGRGLIGCGIDRLWMDGRWMKNGRTALMMAAYNNKVECVNWMLTNMSAKEIAHQNKVCLSLSLSLRRSISH